MMKLYTTPASPFGARVLIQIYSKKLPVQILPPPGDFGSEELKAINPLIKIPVLETEETKIIESEVIQEYLQEKFPEPSLLAKTPALNAKIRTLSRISDLYLLPPILACRSALKENNKNSLKDDERMKDLPKVFDALNYYMSGDEYAVADTLSLADCSMAPLFNYLEYFAQKLDVDLNLSSYSDLNFWLRHIRQNEFVERVLAEIEQARP